MVKKMKLTQKKMTKKKKAKLIGLLVFICAAAAVTISVVFSKSDYDFSYLLNNEDFTNSTDFKSLGTNDQVKDMSVAAENETLALMVNEKTAEIAVLDKRSNTVWYSNPQDRAQDALANTVEKNNLSSQLIVNYFDKDRKEQVYNSYSDSVAKQQFTVKSVENGICVTYTFGNLSTAADNLPRFITPERLQSFLDKLDDASRKDLARRYFESTTHIGFMEIMQASFKSQIVINNMLDEFARAGYTKEDLAYDNQMSGVDTSANKVYCVIPIVYCLDSDKLSVTIPADQIEETPGVKISSINLLKFFGAGSVKEQGYMVVPNGVGSIINFNNGKTKEDAYFQPVYGTDSILLKSTRTQVTEEARLPIFGINKGNSGFIAYIDKGDSVANINADISRKTNSYNVAYPSFNLRSNDKLSMSGVNGTDSDMTIVDSNMIKSDINVRYCFLPDGQADYSSMASYYQNVLVSEGVLKPLEDKGSVPLYLDLIGAVEKDKFFVGIPYNGLVSMTDYEQANKILDSLNEKGINNIQLRYLGWFNGGINHNTPKSVKPVNILGSSKELAALQARLQDMGGNLYPDVAFQYVLYRSSNYSESKEAARYLDGTPAFVANYDRSLLRMRTMYNAGLYQINSPKVLPGQIDQFIKSYDRLGLQNLSLRDLGSILSSDKNSKSPVDRETAKLIVNEQLGKLDFVYDQLLISSGNQYALGYTQNLVDIPDTSNQFFIVDEEIPFYQMVIHGFIDYTGTAVNISEGYDQKIEQLKMIEYGMAPHYLWTYEPTSAMNQTAYEEYYSTQYDLWLDDAVQNYNVVNGVYQQTRTSRMQKDIIIEAGVRKVVYDNGSVIYVNYNDTSKEVDGITIEAKGYVLGGGGQ